MAITADVKVAWTQAFSGTQQLKPAKFLMVSKTDFSDDCDDSDDSDALFKYIVPDGDSSLDMLS